MIKFDNKLLRKHPNGKKIMKMEKKLSKFVIVVVLAMITSWSYAQKPLPTTDQVWKDWKNHSVTKSKTDIPWNLKMKPMVWGETMKLWNVNKKELGQPYDGCYFSFGADFEKDADGFTKSFTGIMQYYIEGNKWVINDDAVQAYAMVIDIPNRPSIEARKTMTIKFLNSDAPDKEGSDINPVSQGTINILSFEYDNFKNETYYEGLFIVDKDHIEFRFDVTVEYCTKDYRGGGVKLIEKKSGKCNVKAAYEDNAWVVTETSFNIVNPAQREIVEKMGDDFLPDYQTINGGAKFDEIFNKRKIGGADNSSKENNKK